MSKRVAFYNLSSGNVFRDLAIPDPEEALAKAELAAKIAALIKKKNLTQTAAGKLLGIDQPKVSALLRGRLTGFSTERLMRFLLMLGQDIKITVQPAPRSRPKARVSVA
jgi:predicted XRE-type DNA-binding protein